MKLITELNTDLLEFKTTTDTANGKKNLYIEGVFAQSEIINKNNRVYPRSVMEGAMTKYITEKVDNRTAYGELGHPEGPKINEDRISHLIESLDWDKNNVMGRARILNTNMGKIVEGIIDGGGRVGVSTRGLGSVKPNNNGIMEVQNDFRIATAADIVTDPSGPNCMVNGIMEGVEWVFDATRNTFMENRIEQFAETIKKMDKHELNEKKLSLFTMYLAEIAKPKIK